MRSNYKKIGEFVQQVKNKNNANNRKVEHLRGINITKEFMPSVANVTGTDLSVYKIVEKNQFAYNPMHVGRDEILPISMLAHEDSVIVSPAYVVFEIVNTNDLLPEYLMMWCRRSEFDRNAWFTTDSSVRGGFNWEDFCDLELPVPSIEKQNELIKEYHTITDRIKLNEQLNQKLKNTAQSIYKEWFVNFEFPDESGNPYKSNGGEMVYNEKLNMEIPNGWKTTTLENLCTLITKGTTPQKMFENKFDSNVNYLKAECINSYHGIDEKKLSFIEKDVHFKELKRSILEKNDLLFSIAGTLGKFSKVYKKILPANINQAIAIIRVDQNKISLNYIEGLFLSGWHNEFYRDNVQQAVQENLSLTTIKALPILKPYNSVLNKITEIMDSILKSFEKTNIENQLLTELKEVLLSKMATIEG